MSDGPVVLLYTRAGCTYSDAKRAELAARGANVREVDVDETPQVVTELLKLTGGRRVVPVVVEGGRIEIAPDGGTEF